MGWGWADTLQSLIGAGHSLSDVRDYTLGQVKAYMRAIARAEARREQRMASAARSAWMDGKDFKKYVESLDEG